MKLSAALLACALTAAAQNPPKFEVDPTWPKPLPAGWITGQLGGERLGPSGIDFKLGRVLGGGG